MDKGYFSIVFGIDDNLNIDRWNKQCQIYNYKPTN